MLTNSWQLTLPEYLSLLLQAARPQHALLRARLADQLTLPGGPAGAPCRQPCLCQLRGPAAGPIGPAVWRPHHRTGGPWPRELCGGGARSRQRLVTAGWLSSLVRTRRLHVGQEHVPGGVGSRWTARQRAVASRHVPHMCAPEACLLAHPALDPLAPLHPLRQGAERVDQMVADQEKRLMQVGWGGVGGPGRGLPCVPARLPHADGHAMASWVTHGQDTHSDALLRVSRWRRGGKADPAWSGCPWVPQCCAPTAARRPGRPHDAPAGPGRARGHHCDRGRLAQRVEPAPA